MKSKCPKCGNNTEWIPAPTQQDDEDNWGPFSKVDDFIRAPARVSPPDNEGRTWLLVKREPHMKPSYWPASTNCPVCVVESKRIVNTWDNELLRVGIK